MRRVADWVLIAAVGWVWGLGVLRAAMLRLRGVHVFAIDPERTAAEVLLDVAAFGGLGLWAYEAIAFAWPIGHHATPETLALPVIGHGAFGVLGGALLVAGMALWTVAVRDMGGAWRIGIDRRSPGGMVTRGVFGWTRNPIYLAFDLLVVGTFLVEGRLLFLVTAAVLPLLLHGVILREERFLEQRHGPAYRAYCARVGRYVTV